MLPLPPILKINKGQLI